MKLHVSMRVGDFGDAARFYNGLFGQKPTFTRENYAKWDVADPSGRFVIEAGHTATDLDQVGIQVTDSDELQRMSSRMRGIDRPFVDVKETSCCYARMEKAWIKGAAGDKWEAFLTHSRDETAHGTDRANPPDMKDISEECCGRPKSAATCCTPSEATTA